MAPGTLAYVERKISRGQDVSGPDLARVLRANPGQVLPVNVLDLVCRYLEEGIRKRRGRKPGGARHELRDAYAASLYERYLAWLQGREKRFGLNGWSALQRADWWQGPPYERACRMVARRLFANHTWEHVRNVISRKASKTARLK